MNTDTRELITWVIGTTLSLAVLIGLAVRYILMPYLKDHIVTPMKAVEKQVTENHHSNTKPTILDRIDDAQNEVKEVATQVKDVSAQVSDVAVQVKALGRMFDGHLKWSDRWVDLIEREMRILRRERKDDEEHETGDGT